MIAIARPLAGRNIGLLIESDGPGGAEQVIAHLAEHLHASGSIVTVLVPADGEGWLARRLAGLPIVVEGIPLGGPLSPHGIMALTAALRRHAIDLLHTHEFGQALAGASAAALCHIPHVITMHGGQYYAERKRRRAALRLAIAMSGGITAVSAPLGSHLEARLHLRKGQVEVLPNGARPAPGGVNGVRASLGISAKTPLLLAVGNLYRVKGHKHLLRALELLREQRPELHLAIAGRGEEGPALQAQARAAGFADRVHLLGLRDDVGALLHAADLFVHPSLAEGLPLAVLEAMFAGCSIIATAVGAIPTVLADGAAGTLVPPADPVALAAAIEQMVDDPATACTLGARAAERAQAEYGIDRMGARYQALYARLLPPQRSA
jgi:glycosyltransferase involved in cell wall biosynthesis